MSWTLELSYGDKHGAARGLEGWPAVREKVLAALARFVPNDAERALLVERVEHADAERNQFLAIAASEWRIMAQVELNPAPWTKDETTTVEV